MIILEEEKGRDTQFVLVWCELLPLSMLEPRDYVDHSIHFEVLLIFQTLCHVVVLHMLLVKKLL